MVNYIGAARRLRALAADNWSTRELSELSGMCRSDLTRWRYGEFPQITLKNHERIKELYEKIQGLADPRGHGRGTATHARRLGYLPSECWNDDEIDDPDAVPLPMPPDTDDHIAVTNMIEDALMWPSPGKAAGYDRSVKREIARHAVNRLGWSYERVAELLGFKSANSVEYMLIGRKDRPRTRGGR
jgi:DNA-binding Xre family transcriptional regulator